MFGRKKKLTIEEFVEVIYYFARKFSVDYVSHEMGKENSPFKDVDKDVFIHERFLLIFWIIDKFFADTERKLIVAVHKQYFSDLGILNNQEKVKKEISFIKNRFKEYNDAHSDKAGPEQHFLGAAIAKNILQQDKLTMNFLISSLVAMDVMLLVKQMKESIFDQYELK